MEWLINKIKHISNSLRSIMVLIFHKEDLHEALSETILYINPASKILSVYNCSYKNFMIADAGKIASTQHTNENFMKENTKAKESLQNIQKKIQKQTRQRSKSIAKSKNKTHDIKDIGGRVQFGGGNMDKSAAAKTARLKKKAIEREELNKICKQRRHVPLHLEGAVLDGVSAETTLVSLQDVTFNYDGCSSSISVNVSAQIRSKDKILLQGSNGVGKSSLIKLIMGNYSLEVV